MVNLKIERKVIVIKKCTALAANYFLLVRIMEFDILISQYTQIYPEVLINISTIYNLHNKTNIHKI